MAYSSSGTLGDRLDSGRFRSPDIPSTSSFSFFDQPNTTAVSQNTPQTSSLQEARASLHRRFTTNNLPTTNAPSPIGQPRRQQQQQQPETSSPDSTYSVSPLVIGTPITSFASSISRDTVVTNLDPQINHKVQLVSIFLGSSFTLPLPSPPAGLRRQLDYTEENIWLTGILVGEEKSRIRLSSSKALTIPERDGSYRPSG